MARPVNNFVPTRAVPKQAVPNWARAGPGRAARLATYSRSKGAATSPASSAVVAASKQAAAAAKLRF